MSTKSEIIGQVYKSNKSGKFRVVSYKNNTKVGIEFLDTGYRTTVQLQQITNGGVKDKLRPRVQGVGFLGVGIYKATEKGKDTRASSIWRGIFERCYAKKRSKRNESYKGCTVCDEWHNFQNFAKWYYENYIEGFHLDKDIKIDGNKIYGPDFCIFTSPSDNNVKAQARTYTLKSPSGEIVKIYNMAELCRKEGLNHGCMSMLVSGGRGQHKGWTRNDAQSK